MRIKNIKIENYRGILNEEIEFNEKVNVFIGGNGAGKTTLLEAIVASLIKLVHPLGRDQYLSFILSNKDINYNKKYTYIYTDAEVSILKKRQQLDLFIEKGFFIGKPRVKELNKNFKEFKAEFDKHIENNEFTLPILKYYPSNRNSKQYIQDYPPVLHKNSKFEAWSNFIHTDLSYSRFFKWFLDYETQELREQRDAGSFQFKSPIINNVRKAIQKALKKLTGKDYIIKSQAIQRRGINRLIPSLAIQEKGAQFSEILDNKSDGEKTIISLIADIAYNLSIAHDFTKDDDFLKNSGIILIDEIEAHLHPNWQRKIIPLLIELFPNIQFFITTHSPQAIASVNSQNIFICDNFKFRKIDFKSKGMDSNTLLTTFFDTNERPTEYAKLIAEFRDMMDANVDINKLERRIQEIEALNQDDEGEDQSQLIEELHLELAAHKFDLEHEIN